jgi:hypothetical protein
MKTHRNATGFRRPRSGAGNTFGDFVCMSCRNFVSAEAALSSVRHRNHCPYCLSSRHLDLYEAGDRLSACKARMRLVALTLKKTFKKYTQADRGELMLVHLCEDCGRVSINRFAADDDVATVLEIFDNLRGLDAQTKSVLIQSAIIPLGADDRQIVLEQLLGRNERQIPPEPVLPLGTQML